MFERKHKTLALALAAGFAVSYAGAAAAPARAATNDFWNVSSGDWSNASNWTDGEPTSSANAHVENGGTATITQTGEQANILIIAGPNGTTGTLQMNAGSLTTTQGAFIGNHGNATFNLNGGTLSTGDAFAVGRMDDGQGTFNFSGGTLQLGANNYQIGQDGTGHVTQTDGDVTTAGAIIGNNSGSDGSYDLSGGSIASSTIIVGNHTTGTLSQTGGDLSAPANNTSNSIYLVGNASNGTGSVDQSAGTTTTDSLFVGSDGSGDYTISGGTLTLGSDMSVGAAMDKNGDAVSGNSGLFTVSGADGQINVGGNLLANGDDATLAFNVDASGVSIINVVGDATIAPSTVNMGLLESFSPADGQSYDLITAASIDGVPTLASEDTDNWSLDLVGAQNGQALQATYVPEPASLALLGLGGLTLLSSRRRRVRA